MHSKAIQCSFRESQASCSSYLYIQLVFDLENIGRTHLPSVIHPTYSGIIQTQYNSEKRIPILEIFATVKMEKSVS